jgi:hypothetical protein
MQRRSRLARARRFVVKDPPSASVVGIMRSWAETTEHITSLPTVRATCEKTG